MTNLLELAVAIGDAGWSWAMTALRLSDQNEVSGERSR